MEKQRTRVETSCRNTAPAKDGTMSVTICKTIAERVRKICSITNQNRTRFVEMCVKEYLDTHARDELSGKTKDELIDIILNN